MSENAWVALEWSSAVLGACYTFLAAYEKRIGWVFAVVSSIMFVVYYHHRNYTGQAVLNVYYVAMGVYGWMSWGRDEAHKPVTRRPLRWHGVALGVSLLATAAVALLFARLGWSESPWMDAWVGVFSALATWMMAQKVLENWLYWCLVDGVAITMFLTAEPPMVAYAVLFATYVCLSVVGWWKWSSAYKASTLTP